MSIINKKYVALEFYDAFSNSLVILDKYFSPFYTKIFISEILTKLGSNLGKNVSYENIYL